MKKKYYLYLDESGDFAQDLTAKSSNECLVGGFLMADKEISEGDMRHRLTADWRAVQPEDRKASDDTVMNNLSHAAELNRKVSGPLHLKYIESAAKLGKLVIFENYRKAEIVDSSVTYLNITVDGIVQLFSSLLARNAGDEIGLQVLIGRRVDAARGGKRRYIEPARYKKELRKRLDQEKVTNQALSRCEEISLSFAKDKEDPRLILCDYICHFYFTRTASVFDARISRNESYRDAILKFFDRDKDYRFELYGSGGMEKARSLINNEHYDSALLELCGGSLPSGAEQMILDAFAKLPKAARTNDLRSLARRIDTIIRVERDLEGAVETILNNAEKLARHLREKQIEDEIFELDVGLYRLAQLNHLGKIAKMEKLFVELRPKVDRIGHVAEHKSYLYIFYNRYSVFLIDSFQVKESLALLRELEKAFEAFSLHDDVLFESLNQAGVSLPGGPVKKAPAAPERSVQLGKILGSETQCLRYLLSLDQCSYEEAANTSNRAMENFTEERDLQRQYQYRAQIEGEAGRLEEARAYLCKGFSVPSLADLARLGRKEDRSKNPLAKFSEFHLAFFLKCFAGGPAAGECRKLIQELNKRKAVLFQDISYPTYVAIADLAAAMWRDGSFDRQTAEYYQKAAELDKDAQEPLHAILKLLILAEYAAYCLDTGRDAGPVLEDMHARIARIRTKELAGNMENVLKQTEQTLAGEVNKQALLQLAKIRQY